MRLAVTDLYVEGAINVSVLLMFVLNKSLACVVEPQPDDVWRLTVKQEDSPHLLLLAHDLGLQRCQDLELPKFDAIHRCYPF